MKINVKTKFYKFLNEKKVKTKTAVCQKKLEGTLDAQTNRQY